MSRIVDESTGEELFLRTAFNYDRNRASDESGLCCDDPSLAQQHFAEECDINTIVRRFGLTGQLPDDVRVPESGDFEQVTDFQSAMNVIRAAEEAFMEMPGEVRARFNNDPARFMEFVHDPKNLDEARKLGIANPAPVPVKVEPMPVRVVADAPPGTSST